jgi:hypothetical protein
MADLIEKVDIEAVVAIINLKQGINSETGVRQFNEFYLESKVDKKTEKPLYQLVREKGSANSPERMLATGWTSANDIYRHLFTMIQAFDLGFEACEINSKTTTGGKL